MSKPDNERTTLYHSDLVKRGECTLDITSDVLESKHKKGSYYVCVVLEGRKRQYSVENDTIKRELSNRNGHRCTVVAGGTKDTVATLQIVKALWTAECEPQTQAQSQPAQSAQPPARTNQPQSRPAQPPERPQPSQPATPAATNQASRPATEKITSGPMLTKLGNLMMKCVTTERAVAKELREKRGIETTVDESQSRVAMLFIQMTRDNFHHQQPGDHLVDLTPKGIAPLNPVDNASDFRPVDEESDDLPVQD